MLELWLSVTEAAHRLSAKGDPVDRSSLSRYLKQYGGSIPQRRDGKYNLVEFQSLLAHRKENLRIQDLAALSPTRVRVSEPNARTEGVKRRDFANAEMREMDVIERRGALTVVDEVTAAKRDAILIMCNSFDEAIRVEAPALSAKYGWPETELRDALGSFSEIGITVFRNEIMAASHVVSGEGND